MPKIAPAIAAEIVRIRTEERLMLREIAEREFTVTVRVSMPAISRILRAAGLRPAEHVRAKGSKINIDRQQAVDLRRGGMSYGEIAALMGVGRTTIYYVANPDRARLPKSAALRRERGRA